MLSSPPITILVVYLLIVWASALLVVSRLYRLCSYALFLTAGLLKYYPLVLLLLLARERQRHAILAATIVGLIVISFGGNYHFELGKALAIVPSASYFTDALSAENPPFGFGAALGDGRVALNRYFAAECPLDDHHYPSAADAPFCSTGKTQTGNDRSCSASQSAACW